MSNDAGNALPLNSSLTLTIVLSSVVATLLAGVSIAGILDSHSIYPNADLLNAYLPTDVVNLVIGVPVLLLSALFAMRGKWVWLLLWPGALFFMLYSHLNYSFALPLSVASLLHLTLVGLSLYTLVLLLTAIDAKAVRQRLEGRIPRKLTGWILVGLGGPFFLLAVGTLGNSVISGTPLSDSEIALQMTDFLTAPAWIIGGILLWQRKPLSYFTGLGLLFQACMLFVGLIGHMLLQPVLFDAPIAWVDVLVIAVMSLVSFVPFVRYVKGVLAAD